MVDEPEKMPFNKQTIRGHAEVPYLAPKLVEFPEGVAMIRMAKCLTAIDLESEAGKFVGIITCADHGGAVLHGAIGQLTPAEARNFAATLLASADRLDPNLRGNDG